MDFGEAFEGIHSLSDCVFEKRGAPVTALAVTGPASRTELASFKALGASVQERWDLIPTNLERAE